VRGIPMTGAEPRPFTPAHVLIDEGYLFCRYVRR